MKQVIILCLGIMLISSCDKGLTVYQMRILIKNGTDSAMTVRVFPKSRYLMAGKYSYSDMHTKNKDTTFVPDTRLGTELFSTDTLDMEPHILAARVFDSINVVCSSKKVLRFTPEKAVNYRLNPFSDRSAWLYEKNIFEHVRMWRDNNVESEDYIFVIDSID